MDAHELGLAGGYQLCETPILKPMCLPRRIVQDSCEEFVPPMTRDCVRVDGKGMY